MVSERSEEGGPGGIALVGYRATGKSTVGRIVADRLGWDFEDADEALERRVGRSIPQIFAEEGEGAFRDFEQETIEALTRRGRLVLATGGGAVLRPENRRALRDFGLVVWLSARPGTIAERLRNDPRGRPALTSAGLIDEVESVIKQREPLYREVAGDVVETDDRSAEEVAMRVLDRVIGDLGTRDQPQA